MVKLLLAYTLSMSIPASSSYLLVLVGLIGLFAPPRIGRWIYIGLAVFFMIRTLVYAAVPWTQPEYAQFLLLNLLVSAIWITLLGLMWRFGVRGLPASQWDEPREILRHPMRILLGILALWLTVGAAQAFGAPASYALLMGMQMIVFTKIFFAEQDKVLRAPLIAGYLSGILLVVIAVKVGMVDWLVATGPGSRYVAMAQVHGMGDQLHLSLFAALIYLLQNLFQARSLWRKKSR
jgi:hypothetical protein